MCFNSKPKVQQTTAVDDDDDSDNESLPSLEDSDTEMIEQLPATVSEYAASPILIRSDDDKNLSEQLPSDDAESNDENQYQGETKDNSFSTKDDSFSAAQPPAKRLCLDSNQSTHCCPQYHPKKTQAAHIDSSVVQNQNQQNVVVFTALLGLLQRGYETSLGWWVLIFEFLVSKQDYVLRIELRRQCKLFRDALPAVVQTGIYITWPHPGYETIKDLIHSLNDLSKLQPMKVPKYLFVQKGSHIVPSYKDGDGDDCNCIRILFPLHVLGEGSDKTFIRAGFDIEGNPDEEVVFKDLSVHNATFTGMFGNNGSSFLCEKCCISYAGTCGVVARNTKGTLRDCQIESSGIHGVWSWCHGIIQMEGTEMKVHKNCTRGSKTFFGMLSCCASSKILLRLPLTKEMACMENGGGGNFGGTGKIESVLEFGNGGDDSDDDDDDDDVLEIEIVDEEDDEDNEDDDDGFADMPELE